MEQLLRNIRFAVRVMGRKPLMTLVVVLSMGLGIGANTAVFTLINTLFLRPLPFQEPERLVALYTLTDKNPGFFPSSYLNFLDFRAESQVFSGMAAHMPLFLSLSGKGDPQQISSEMVTGNYFELLGVKPALGRTFRPEEDKTPGSHLVAVLSYGFWQRQLGADPQILGKTIRLNNQPFTVIGVAPQGFGGINALDAKEIWVPTMTHKQVLAGTQATMFEIRRGLIFNIVARLKPGVSVAQASSAMATLSQSLELEHPKDNEGRETVVVPLVEATISPNVRHNYVLAGGLLMAVVGLVLLIACANVANLLLVRAAARRKEIAIRLAVGSTRRMLISQLLVESMLLALLGGAFGLLIASWAQQALWSLRPPEIPQTLEMSLDGRVLVFTVVLSLLTGLLFGLVPALQSSKVSVLPALKDQGWGTQGRSRVSLRSGLVVVQVALSLISLIGAGLFLRSLRSAQALDLGFDPEDLAVLSFNLGAQGYDQPRTLEFYRQVAERARATPGVQSAAVSEDLLLSGGGLMRTSFIDSPADPKAAEGVLIQNNSVGLGYFDTMGIRIVRGRDFTSADREGAPYVVIINETMARRFWPGAEAVGRRFKFNGLDDWFEVVGIAEDCKYNTLGEEPQPYLYLPIEQIYPAAATLHIRTAAGDPATVLAGLRKEVQALDRSLPLVNIWTVQEVIKRALWAPRMGAILLGIFGALALILASVGLYGVLAYSVAQRRREIGIRMALGANQPQVLKLIFREGLSLVTVGIICGLLAAVLAMRAVSSLLFGIGTTDPVAYGTTAALLVLVAIVSIYLPARRATQVDPLVVLRD